MDVVLPILFAVISLIGLIAGKKKKEQEQSHGEVDSQFDDIDIPMPRSRVREFSGSIPEEGVSDMKTEMEENNDSQESPSRVKMHNIDKKKLIVYSEIMKPKFDDRQ